MGGTTTPRQRFGRIAGLVLVIGALVALAPSAPASAVRQGDDLRFAVTWVEVSERAIDIDLEVVRTTAQSLEESVASFTTVDSGAAAFDDYVPTRGRLRLGVGQTSARINVLLSDDDDAEPGGEAIIVRLSPPDDPDRVLDEAVVVIRDDDQALTPVAAAAATPSGASARPAGAVIRPAPVRRANPNVRRVAAAPTPRRVTILEIHGDTATPVPSPATPSPLAAAGLLAALALGRVAAEVWFRWRLQAS